MTIHSTKTSRGRRSLPAFTARETLEQLPSRRPPEPSSVSCELAWERVESDRYVVRRGTQTVGFVDVVGAVFVVLVGPRYSHAVEFAQTLVFEEALGALAAGDTSGTSGSRPQGDRPTPTTHVRRSTP